jgi:hypothetical protein
MQCLGCARGDAGAARTITERAGTGALAEVSTGGGSGRAWPAGLEAWVNRATWAFVALGLAVRLVRYLVVYPIWHDEAFLGVNFLDRDYVDLLRPLDYAQVSPVLFLAIELTAVRLLGFSEWSLRLFPTLCALASVLLFRHLAARLLRGVPLLLAVAILATSFYPIRHGAEVKPYASDLLASLVLLVLAVEWWCSPHRVRAWWVMAAVVPILLALSYPAVIVAAGLSLALGPAVLRLGERRVRIAFVAYNIVAAAAFVSIYCSFIVIQSNALRSFYRWGYWRASFPPWDEPWRLPAWLIDVHTGTAMAYPIGGERGASLATTIGLLVGLAVLWRRGPRTLLYLLVAPFAMGLTAAGLGRYPYGGAPRLTQYLVPSICLLTGVGAAAVLGRLGSRARRRALVAATAGLATIGLFLIGRDLIRPFRAWGDVETRAFAHRFWRDTSRGAELVCVKSDLGFTWQPKLWNQGMSAVYLFHQAMFAAPRPRHSAFDLTGAPTRRGPVRLVFFDDLPTGNPFFEQWLTRIRRNYAIAATETYTVAPVKPSEPWLRDRYVVLDLIPKAATAATVASAIKDYSKYR